MFYFGYFRYFVALTFSLIVLIGFSKWLYFRKQKFELFGIWNFCDFCRLLDSSQNISTLKKKNHVSITSVVTITDVITPILQRFCTLTDVICSGSVFLFLKRLQRLQCTEVICYRYYIESGDRCNISNTYYIGHYHIGRMTDVISPK